MNMNNNKINANFNLIHLNFNIKLSLINPVLSKLKVWRNSLQDQKKLEMMQLLKRKRLNEVHIVLLMELGWQEKITIKDMYPSKLFLVTIRYCPKPPVGATSHYIKKPLNTLYLSQLGTPQQKPWLPRGELQMTLGEQEQRNSQHVIPKLKLPLCR